MTSTEQNAPSRSSDSDAGSSLYGVVCDHCLAQYAVNIAEFDSRYHRTFQCSSCGQAWTEYLDDDVFDEIQNRIASLREATPSPVRNTTESLNEIAESVDLPPELVEEDRDGEDRNGEDRNGEDKNEEDGETDGLMEGIEDKIDDIDASEESGEDGAEEPLAEEDKPESEGSKPEETEAESQTRDLEPRARPKPEQPDEPEEVESEKQNHVNRLVALMATQNLGKISLWPLIAASVFIVLVFAASGGYFYFLRYDIINQSPIAIGAYQRVGLNISPVEGLEVDIDGITRQAVVVSGEDVRYEFDIKATVSNLATIEKRLPFLRVYLLDNLSDVIEFWDINLTSRVLGVGEKTEIITKLPQQYAGNENIESVEMRLITRQEREILGINDNVSTQSISTQSINN